jgi:hypothetical protein
MRTIKSTLHPCPWLMKTEPNKPCASLPLQVSKEVEGLLAMAVFSEVGYGTNTLFSCDKWLNGRSIRDRYGRQGLPRVPVALGEGPVALGEAFPECNSRERGSRGSRLPQVPKIAYSRKASPRGEEALGEVSGFSTAGSKFVSIVRRARMVSTGDNGI